MTTMRVVGECFFWYRLTRVFPDKFHRAVKRLCVCVYICNICEVMKLLICRGCLNPVTNTGCTSVDIGASGNLELVDKFCYLGDMLSLDGDADAPVDAQYLNWMEKNIQAVGTYHCLQY